MSLLWRTRRTLGRKKNHETNNKKRWRSFVFVCFCAALFGLLYESSELNYLLGTKMEAIMLGGEQEEEEETVNSNKGPSSFIKTSYRNAINSDDVGWSVWKRTDPIRNYPQALECDWTTFRTESGVESPMCVHRGRDIVSGTIRRKGRWQDCDVLTRLWNEHPNNDDKSVYLDIGANIGSCVMQMLLSTNATIVAFEPHPKNQFCLTSTLLKMEERYRNRVYLFPLGLGNQARGKSTIHAATNNMGNSIVGGKVIKDAPSQQFHTEVPIALERLDDLLDASRFDTSWSIPLVKMDAQGFECYILEGMPNLLSKIQTIKAELADQWLSGFEGCSDEIFLNKLRSANFDVYWKNKILTGPPPRKGLAEIVARPKNKNN